MIIEGCLCGSYLDFVYCKVLKAGVGKLNCRNPEFEVGILSN